MTEQDFELQAKRMESFLKWLYGTANTKFTLTPDEYDNIFYKIGDKRFQLWD